MKINGGREETLKRAVPPLVGILLIALFARLGFWQLDRAQQKIDLQLAFDRPAGHVLVSGNIEPVPFQDIEAQGQYLTRRQIFIENAILDGRLGYYVISPFEFSANGPLLLVNRGWIQKKADNTGLPEIEVTEEALSIRGKTGHLPRVGIRPGEAFASHAQWPRVGVWPTSDEVAVELGHEVLPYVLLLDPDQEQGYKRKWQPPQSGPSTHYGYAFQWFAMASTLLIMVGWNLKKRLKKHAY